MMNEAPASVTENPLLSHAFAYANVFGWPVFPLHSVRGSACSCVRGRDCDNVGKHPRTEHGVLDATTNEETIRRWWAKWPDANIGLATGAPSGVVVIDIDPRHGGRDSFDALQAEHGRLDTVEVLTGGGGRHLFFRCPSVEIKNKTAIMPGIDVRGTGGYVVAVPSLHLSGHRYNWELSSRPDELPLAEMPGWLIDLITTAGGHDTPQAADPEAKIKAGQRNMKLASLAGAMRRKGAGLKAMEAGLLAENEDKCEPPLSEFEVLKIARSVARYEPEPAPVKLILPKGGHDCAAWLDDYISHAKNISPMTPGIFHESSGLWLLSTAIARRLVLSMPFGPVYPNLYILWLAETTLHRKTTGQAVPRAVAEKAFSYLIAPQDSTPEALLNDMAGNEPPNMAHLTLGVQEAWRNQRNYAAQRGMVMDEMSGLMAGAGRDYNAGLIEAYLRFYDCEASYIRSTRNQGWQVVRNAYVSILGASTPAAMAPHMGAERLWANGWWPRFVILTPTEERPAWQEPQETGEPTDLINDLRSLLGRLPQGIWPNPAPAIPLQMQAEAHGLWAAYNKLLSFDLLQDENLDRRLFGTYGRLPMQALKVSMLLAATDWPQGTATPLIERRHMLRALAIAESWRESVHRALESVRQSESDRLYHRVLRCVAEAGANGVTVRDIHRKMRDTLPSKIKATLEELIITAEVEAIERKGHGRSAVSYIKVTE